MEYPTTESRAGSVALLGLERTALATGKIRLFKAPFVPNPTTTQAEFVAQECGFGGYAAVVLGAWNAVGIDQSGQAQCGSSDAFFQATDAVTPENVGGAWLETATAGLYEYCVFPVPIPMVAALQFIAMNWHLRQPGPGFVDVES